MYLVRPDVQACHTNCICPNLKTKIIPFWRPACSSAGVAMAKITGEGLAAITVLVAVLWVCAIGERVIVARANAQAAETLRAMRSLQIKNRRQPTASPARPAQRRLHPELG